MAHSSLTNAVSGPARSIETMRSERQSLRLFRCAPAYHGEPLRARHVADPSVVDRIEVAHLVESLGEFLGVPFVVPVEIARDPFLDGLDIAGHGHLLRANAATIAQRARWRR